MLNYLGYNARWLTLSYLSWGIGEGLWIYIQSLYITKLGANPEQIGLVLSLGWLIKLLVYLPAGWLADRFGPRRVMMPVWFLGTTGVIGIALAPNWHWLIPGFVIYGMSGAAVPLSGAYLSRVVKLEAAERPEQTFSRVLTTLSAGFSIGLIFSPALGGKLAEIVGLQPVFVFSAFWFILSTLAAMRTKQIPHTPRHAEASGYGTLFRQKWLIFVLLAVGLLFAAATISSPTVMTPKLLTEERGVETDLMGLLGSINAAGATLLSLWLGRNRKPLQALAAALMLIWIGSGLLLVCNYAVGLGISYLLLGGLGVTRPLIESIVVPQVREDQQGVLMALIGSLQALGIATGTGIAGSLYANRGPTSPFVFALAALPVASVLCWLILRRCLPERRRA